MGQASLINDHDTCCVQQGNLGVFTYHGLLAQHDTLTVVAGPTHSCYVKVQWETVVAHQWSVVFRIGFVTPKNESDVMRTLRNCKFPRGGEMDMQAWLGEFEAISGTWRIETEVIEPVVLSTVARCLYLHHLLCALLPLSIDCDGPSLPEEKRQRFCAEIQTDTFSMSQADIKQQYMQTGLWHMCTVYNIPFNPKIGFPTQGRPRDLECDDRHLLIDSLACHNLFVTAKADGRESFLFGHPCGVSLLFRSGETHNWQWRELTGATTTFPLLLECEAWVKDNTAFVVAYDVLVTPLLAYVSHASYATRLLALNAVVNQLALCHKPRPLCVITKASFHFTLYPHQAVRRCIDWATNKIKCPCDGVILYDGRKVCPVYTPLRNWACVIPLSCLTGLQLCCHMEIEVFDNGGLCSRANAGVTESV